MGKESRKRERKYREPKKIVLSLSKKNLIIRGIIAVVCLFLGAILITNSCSQLGDNSGELKISFPTFSNYNDEKETLFDNQIDINYYYNKDTATSEKKNTIEKIESILDEMVEYHQLLDYDDLYLKNKEYLPNLKYINDHPNNWIKIDLRLYNVLKEANNLSKETNGKYSIFAGRLYETWNNLFYLHELYGANIGTIQDKDPFYNKNCRDEIAMIVNGINSESTYLEFNDETLEVKFNLDENNKEYVILDLGFYEQAYYLDFMKALFISNNLTSGMISTNTGMVTTLGRNFEQGYYQINGVSYQTIYNGDYVFDYSFYYNTSLSGMMFNPLLDIYLHNNNKMKYYYFFNENNIIMRSIILNAKTGYSDFSVQSSFTFSFNKGLVYQLKDNYNLYFDYSSEYLSTLDNIEKYGAIVIYNNGNTNISTTSTTLVSSQLIGDYLKEGYLPYLKISEVVKNKIIASKGE